MIKIKNYLDLKIYFDKFLIFFHENDQINKKID
jgi:hypothetical protein